jgi:serine/threonine protein kinase
VLAAARQLNHPNIAKICGSMEQDGVLVMGMERVDLDLKLFIGASSFGADIVFDYALQIVQGMTYLHGQSPMIIHRRLRPENILVR